MKIGDIVWFQAYKENEPIQGRIKRIGTETELGFGWNADDSRIRYELESLHTKEHERFIFTRTTKRWLSTTKQSWVKPDNYIKNLE
jgi:hypothetical protein